MSSTVKDMLATYPADLGDIDQAKLTRCIEERIACAQASTACADASPSEGRVGDMAKCIRTDMDCADICTATATALSRHTGYVTRAILQACAMVCNACDDERERHADTHEHCRVCAEARRSCEHATNSSAPSADARPVIRPGQKLKSRLADRAPRTHSSRGKHAP